MSEPAGLVAEPRHTGSYDHLLGHAFTVRTGAVMVHSTGSVPGSGGVAYIIPAGWRYDPAMVGHWPHCSLQPLVSTGLSVHGAARRDLSSRILEMALNWVALSGQRPPEDRELQLMFLLKYLDCLSDGYARVLEDRAVAFPGLTFALLARFMGRHADVVSMLFRGLTGQGRVESRGKVLCLSPLELRWKPKRL